MIPIAVAAVSAASGKPRASGDDPAVKAEAVIGWG